MADVATLSQLLEASLDPRQHKEGKYTFYLPTRTITLAMWMPRKLANVSYTQPVTCPYTFMSQVPNSANLIIPMEPRLLHIITLRSRD
jgi:hypothetical protein